MADKKKTERFVKSVDFTNLLPKMTFKKPEYSSLYEKAFLDRNENRQLSIIRIQ